MLALPEDAARIISQALEAQRAELRALLSINEAALTALARLEPVPAPPGPPAEGL